MAVRPEGRSIDARPPPDHHSDGDARSQRVPVVPSISTVLHGVLAVGPVRRKGRLPATPPGCNREAGSAARRPPGIIGATTRVVLPIPNLTVLSIVRPRLQWDVARQATSEVDRKSGSVVSRLRRTDRKSSSLKHGVRRISAGPDVAVPARREDTAMRKRRSGRGSWITIRWMTDGFQGSAVAPELMHSFRPTDVVYSQPEHRFGVLERTRPGRLKIVPVQARR